MQSSAGVITDHNFQSNEYSFYQQRKTESTFKSRFWDFLKVVDPRLFILPNSKIDESLKLVNEMK